MTVYLVGHIQITDPARYHDYEAGFLDALAPFKGTILAADDAPKILEGEAQKGRVVILSFPNQKAQEGWYASDAYQTIMVARHEAANSQIMAVQGFEIPGQ